MTKETRHTCIVCKKKRAKSVMKIIEAVNRFGKITKQLSGRGYLWQCKVCPEQKE